MLALSNSHSHSITLTRAIPFIFEYIPSTISKSTAILSISHLLSIPPSRILAFGDGENDIEMLNLVGYGVVMGNAMESLKERVGGVGKYVTGTNGEGGVGMFLEKVFGLEGGDV
jgi:hydroxymethylpyrimidine pyrophosphatase-like HAD family hydrolase